MRSNKPKTTQLIIQKNIDGIVGEKDDAPYTASKPKKLLRVSCSRLHPVMIDNIRLQQKMKKNTFI